MIFNTVAMKILTPNQKINPKIKTIKHRLKLVVQVDPKEKRIKMMMTMIDLMS